MLEHSMPNVWHRSSMSLDELNVPGIHVYLFNSIFTKATGTLTSSAEKHKYKLF